MKTRALAVPEWVEEERSLLRYLMSPHAGHTYAEDLIDAVSLITSWTLIFLAALSALMLLAAGLVN